MIADPLIPLALISGSSSDSKLPDNSKFKASGPEIEVWWQRFQKSAQWEC